MALKFVMQIIPAVALRSSENASLVCRIFRDQEPRLEGLSRGRPVPLGSAKSTPARLLDRRGTSTQLSAIWKGERERGE